MNIWIPRFDTYSSRGAVTTPEPGVGPMSLKDYVRLAFGIRTWKLRGTARREIIVAGVPTLEEEPFEFTIIPHKEVSVGPSSTFVPIPQGEEWRLFATDGTQLSVVWFREASYEVKAGWNIGIILGCYWQSSILTEGAGGAPGTWPNGTYFADGPLLWCPMMIRINDIENNTRWVNSGTTRDQSQVTNVDFLGGFEMNLNGTEVGAAPYSCDFDELKADEWWSYGWNINTATGEML